MAEGERRYVVDVGLQGLPYPARVVSRAEPEGQHTVVGISISARVNQEFEAKWIRTLIQIVHSHREAIGTRTLRKNVQDYLDKLNATDVSVTFDYPFFVEKTTPVSKEKGRVRLMCAYTAKASSSAGKQRVSFKIQVPCLTTYPGTSIDQPGGFLAQLSSLVIETESDGDIYPEDIVDIVDQKALAPVYSFLSERDEEHIIHQVHSQRRTSIEVADDVKQALAKRGDIAWFSIRAVNYGLLHSYATVIGTERSIWGSPLDWEAFGR